MDRLNTVLRDLKRAVEQYREETSRLEEEKEALGERVGELEALIAKRDEEIQDMENYLNEKDRLIQ